MGFLIKKECKLSKIIKTEGIVFRSLKYSETSLILDVYTLEKGLMSFIVGGVRKAKSKQANVFHPVNIIELVAYDSDQKLSRIKEAGLSVRYTSINFEVAVSAVAIFIIDLARNAIRENESNPELYGFLKSALIKLDEGNRSLKFFPHKFALALSKRLGFEPLNNYSPDKPYFDLLEGEFTDNDIRHVHILSEEMSLDMHRLISQTEISEIGRTKRAELLDSLIDFYKLHLEGFKDLKCLSVLRSVLS